MKVEALSRRRRRHKSLIGSIMQSIGPQTDRAGVRLSWQGNFPPIHVLFMWQWNRRKKTSTYEESPDLPAAIRFMQFVAAAVPKYCSSTKSMCGRASVNESSFQLYISGWPNLTRRARLTHRERRGDDDGHGQRVQSSRRRRRRLGKHWRVFISISGVAFLAFRIRIKSGGGWGQMPSTVQIRMH